MNPLPETKSSLVLSYLELRQAVGTIGILLPFVLMFGKILLDTPDILGSISSYYYSVMGDVFVGSLCAIGVFLGSYRGHGREDSIAGNLACIFALGVAFFPTTPDSGATAHQTLIAGVHAFFAACFFLTLAFFALVLFRRTDPNKQPTPRKKLRNAIYSVCGYMILLSIALIAAVTIFGKHSSIQQFSPVFVFESFAIVAFGISWFVKGEAIFKDE